MGLFSSILGAVAGPIAGLFKKKEKPQKVENTVDYVKMRKAAEAAGFNPLTVLRNGGSAGFGTTIQHPSLSLMGRTDFGDVVAAGINAFAGYDPQSEKRQQLEYDLVQAQLQSVQQQNRQQMRSFDVPVRTGMRTEHSSGGFVSRVPVQSSNPAGALKVTSPWEGSVFQDYLQVHPGLPDAETGSTRYGEIVEMIGGVAVLGGDLAYSGYKLANRTGNVDKAVKEFKDSTKAVREYRMEDRERAGNAWAKSLIPKGRPYYPDLNDFARGRGPY